MSLFSDLPMFGPGLGNAPARLFAPNGTGLAMNGGAHANQASTYRAAQVQPAEVMVGIPALNEADHIEPCLMSLTDDDPWMQQVAIVVADGGSSDTTRKIVRRLTARLPNLRLIDNPERLQSAALNAIAAGAGPRHRYLVRCDAHAAYPPGYVRAVAESLALRPEAASVGTVMDAVGDGCFQRAAAWVVDTPLGSGNSAHRGGSTSGWIDHAHHAGFRLEWFRAIGGYDPAFPHNEDAELDHRLGLAGQKIWLDADIRLNYRMRPTMRKLGKQYWSYGRGRARTVLKHRLRPRLRQLFPVLAVLAIATSLGVGAIYPPALLLTASYVALMAAVSIAGALAMRSACGLWAGPAMGAMHLAWGAGFLRQVVLR
ncbi:glycosyltransferase family 2 protein [Salipiger aestuarii]|uniref:Succinoglycan biosynthesis protein ExoA n=2 Tax=Salipiger aestuarii TaxID=568098 RepID=A0A327Y0M1_9RHOB|nr:glycosyltransferase family 2 protein [Salipiger aestuarii]EIE48632.1 putative glycosyl transferase ExoA [Citreicella sp. 357]RAK13882.1 succinoglycan biosynthesis protein ExoA [Salipiger aestuarii]